MLHLASEDVLLAIVQQLFLTRRIPVGSFSKASHSRGGLNYVVVFSYLAWEVECRAF